MCWTSTASDLGSYAAIPRVAWLLDQYVDVEGNLQQLRELFPPTEGGCSGSYRAFLWRRGPLSIPDVGVPLRRLSKEVAWEIDPFEGS
jgi:hypothetical protein